jgi:hypothetical protein
MFFNVWAATSARYVDGMKTDMRGNLYVTASNEVIVINSTGKHLELFTYLMQQPM